MSRADRLHAALKRRISTSTQEVTVHYPAVPQAALGIPPAPLPVAPLTGTETLQAVPTTTPTPSRAPVTLKCLFYDAYGNFVISLQQDVTRLSRVGWHANANALARVLVEDAALDPAVPQGDTVFTGADYVDFKGKHYEVIGVDLIGVGESSAYTMHVWLRGMAKG